MDDIRGLLNYAYFYLKFRPRSEHEVTAYLLKKIKTRHWSQDHVAQAIQRLKDEGLVNDEVFVSWFVEQRNRSKPKSAYVLRGELARFGIAKSVTDAYFELHIPDEDKLAAEALRTKWRRFAGLTYTEQVKKAASFLARRGFSYEISKKAIEKMREKE